MINHLFTQKILPAVTLDFSEDALPVATAILDGGLPLMEIAFRTEAAAGAIRMIRQGLPQMNVGAGTILTKTQLYQAVDAGASFGLSPGLNPKIVTEAARLNFPFIPGVMTPSEIEIAHDLGCTILKLFPAEQVGGIAFLQSVQAPYAQLNVKFIPMGGVHLQNLQQYLRLKNVLAVGGSWLATVSLIKEKNFEAIKSNVLEAILHAQQ